MHKWALCETCTFIADSVTIGESLSRAFTALKVEDKGEFHNRFLAYPWRNGRAHSAVGGDGRGIKGSRVRGVADS